MNRRRNRVWSWREGAIDPAKDHIVIKYGDDLDDLVPLVYVQPAHGTCFIVEFLLKAEAGDDRTEEILNGAREQLDFYLVDKRELNPWAYARHHCTTAANIYSKFHWVFCRGSESSESDT